MMAAHDSYFDNVSRKRSFEIVAPWQVEADGAKRPTTVRDITSDPFYSLSTPLTSCSLPSQLSSSSTVGAQKLDCGGRQEFNQPQQPHLTNPPLDSSAQGYLASNAAYMMQHFPLAMGGGDMFLAQKESASVQPLQARGSVAPAFTTGPAAGSAAGSTLFRSTVAAPAEAFLFPSSAQLASPQVSFHPALLLQQQDRLHAPHYGYIQQHQQAPKQQLPSLQSVLGSKWTSPGAEMGFSCSLFTSNAFCDSRAGHATSIGAASSSSSSTLASDDALRSAAANYERNLQLLHQQQMQQQQLHQAQFQQMQHHQQALRMQMERDNGGSKSKKNATLKSHGIKNVSDLVVVEPSYLQRRKITSAQPWSEKEHKLFLLLLERHGKGAWQSIASGMHGLRTAAQVASHAQKHFVYNASDPSKKKRGSVFLVKPERGDVEEKLLADVLEARNRAKKLKKKASRARRSSSSSSDSDSDEDEEEPEVLGDEEEEDKHSVSTVTNAKA